MKTERQYNDSLTLFGIGVIGVCLVMLITTWTVPKQTETKPNRIEYIRDTIYITDTIYIHNPIHYRKKEILDAICFVESSFRDSAYNASEDAVGILQIRQCMVNDVNRILGRRGINSLYSMEDRWCPNKSLEMFNIYVGHYGLTDPEEIARCWNGGPRGMSYTYTEPYWDKVQSYLDDSTGLDEDV